MSARRRLRVAFVEPFEDGSHAAFVEGWIARSEHAITVLGLPGERWKWRMRTAAWTLGERLARLRPLPDVVVATSLLDLAHLRVASRLARAPFALYFHENQLSYPRPAGEALDRGFAAAHLASLLAADGVAFNSRFHRAAMLADLAAFLDEAPAPAPRRALAIVRRARVLPPGVDLAGFPAPAERPPRDPPRIVWNHRWEEDKRPSAFARVVDALAERGLSFRLILLGTTSQVQPKPLLALRERHAERLDRAVPAATRQEYVAWMARADVAVSTAAQENFGYAAIEAMAAGAVPLLPRRLSYPEIVPRALHEALLYDGTDDALLLRLARWIEAPEEPAAWRRRVMRAAQAHGWESRAHALDEWVTEIAGRNRKL